MVSQTLRSGPECRCPCAAEQLLCNGIRFSSYVTKPAVQTVFPSSPAAALTQAPERMLSIWGAYGETGKCGWGPRPFMEGDPRPVMPLTLYRLLLFVADLSGGRIPGIGGTPDSLISF